MNVSSQFFEPANNDDHLLESRFFRNESSESETEEEEGETKEFLMRVESNEMGTSQNIQSPHPIKASGGSMEFRQESSLSLKRRMSNEDYDVFQNLITRTQKMVRTQSKVKLTRPESSEQLQGVYEGNQFWQRQSQNTLGVYIRDIPLVNDTIQEIIKMMDYLLQMHDESLFKRISQSIGELRTIEGQLKVVEELLINCRRGPSKRLQELKEFLKPLCQDVIKAEKSNDVNIMMLNYVRDYLIDDLLPTLLHLCQKTLYNEVALDKQKLSSDLGLTNSRLKMINILFCTAVDTSKNDLLSLDRNHPDWKALYAATTFKALGDPEKISRSFENFAKIVLLGHALINSQSEYNNVWARKIVMACGAVYYILWESKAFQHAMNHISDLKVDNAIQVMNMVDQPGLKNVLQLAYPSVAYHEKIYIDPIVMPITTEQLNKEIADGTVNTITPVNLLMVNQELHNQDAYRKELFVKSKSKLKIRVLCSEVLLNPQDDDGFDLEDDELVSFGFMRSLKRMFATKRVVSSKVHDTILFHIHGGGFISQSSSTHQCHTRDWAVALGIPIFSIDYSLAPKHPYPAAIDDCWQAYHWILQTISKYFSTKNQLIEDIVPKKILISGDSAGGNISLALTGLLIKYGQRPPDGIMVAYPATDIRFMYSPSYLYSLNDKILGHTILGICIHSYSLNPATQLMKDPFMSPILLSDEIIAKFPPTRILCGTKDPLVDCSWRFASRLLQWLSINGSKSGVDCKLIMYEEMSHGFLNFNTINGMKEISVCIEDSVKMFKELMTII